MKLIKFFSILIFAVIIPSCSSVTHSYDQYYSFVGDSTQFTEQKLKHEYKLPYPKDAFSNASSFFKSHFCKRFLAVDGQFTISLLNDSVWNVVCPVRYGLNHKELSWSGFDRSSTMLISRKDGEILYFTIGRKNVPEMSCNDFLKWSAWPVKNNIYEEIIKNLCNDECHLPSDTLAILFDDCSSIDSTLRKKLKMKYPIRTNHPCNSQGLLSGDFYMLGKAIVSDDNCRIEVIVSKGQFEYDAGKCLYLPERKEKYIFKLKKGHKNKYVSKLLCL